MTIQQQIELAQNLLRNAFEREVHLLGVALEASIEDEHQNVWYAMACRAENNRFIARLETDLEKLRKELAEL